MMYTILIVDDDECVRSSLRHFFQSDFRVLGAASISEALKVISSHEVHVVFLDIHFKVGHGVYALNEMKKINKSLEVIMLTGDAETKTVVNAIKAGAFDYISKPYEMNHLKEVVYSATHKFRERNGFSATEMRFASKSELIGQSPLIEIVRSMIKKVADINVTVLITGESGVGKEIAARMIHESGRYKYKPFVALNMGAIAENLVESELFGHERGAFTGALQLKAGSFELAHEGTLFLDEISTMGTNTQIKLLRVLQEREFTRVGGVEPIKVDVRVIAATNENLMNLVSKGHFRRDLFFRINVVNIDIPPLRMRKEDIPRLVRHFVKKSSLEFNKRNVKLSEEALKALKNYCWPGNIRELQNIIDRCVALVDNDEIQLEDLPMNIQKNEPDFFLLSPNMNFHESRKYIEVVEKKMLIRVLDANNWNRSKTAEKLGMHRNTLGYKIRKYKIQKESADEIC